LQLFGWEKILGRKDIRLRREKMARLAGVGDKKEYVRFFL